MNNKVASDPKVGMGTPAQTMQIVYIQLFCLLIVFQTISIQIAHVTKQKYQPWNKLYFSALVPMVVVMLLSLVVK